MAGSRHNLSDQQREKERERHKEGEQETTHY